MQPYSTIKELKQIKPCWRCGSRNVDVVTGFNWNDANAARWYMYCYHCQQPAPPEKLYQRTDEGIRKCIIDWNNHPSRPNSFVLFFTYIRNKFFPIK